MKNRFLIVGIIFLVIIGGTIFFLSQPKTPSEITPEIQKTVEQIGSTNTRYQEYSKDVFAHSADIRRVLFFYAEWCPTCRPADEQFREQEEKLPKDMKVIRVNYNDTQTDQEEKELARKYGVTYQHTYVQIDSLGNQVITWNGGSVDELLENIK